MTRPTDDELREWLKNGTKGVWRWQQDQLVPRSDQWTLSPGILIAETTNGTPDGDSIDQANASLIEHAPTLAREVLERREQVKAGQAFKDYTHERLDGAGVPTHPDGEHSKAGCRVGDRFDLLIGERDAARAEVARLREGIARVGDRENWASLGSEDIVAALQRERSEVSDALHALITEGEG